MTDRDLRFGDLFNLVCHPDYLMVAWDHVAHNKGARTSGIDGVTVRQIAENGQVGALIAGIAASLKDAYAGQASADPEAGRQVASAGDPDGDRPGGAAVLENGAGTDLRGRLLAGLLRVPAKTASP
jgi:hypothetical protein